MTWSLFVIHYCGERGGDIETLLGRKDRCFYGNGVFNENFDTILDLLKEENIKQELDLFDFFKKYDLREESVIVNIAYYLSTMDRVVLCKIFSDNHIEFKVYNENNQD